MLDTFSLTFPVKDRFETVETFRDHVLDRKAIYNSSVIKVMSIDSRCQTLQDEAGASYSNCIIYFISSGHTCVGYFM